MPNGFSHQMDAQIVKMQQIHDSSQDISSAKS